MNVCGKRRAHKVVRILAPDCYKRLLEVKIHESGFGYDPLGLERESAMVAFALFRLIYKHWFRVESAGLENVPLEGPAILTPNHSGVIPLDGAMLAVDLAAKLSKPRILRTVVDNFAASLPFVNTFLYRCGQVIGARGNLCDLLMQGELISLFPEGHKGTGKPFRDRYRLRPFNLGFMELSLTYKVPIVPVSVIGAEEQYPYMMDLKPLAKVLHFPYFPLTPLLLLGPLGTIPLPTKYSIRYGEPLRYYNEYPPEAARDPGTVRSLVGQVQSRIQDMIEQGLSRRTSIFGFSLPALKKLLPVASKGMSFAGQRRLRRQGTPPPDKEAPAERSVESVESEPGRSGEVLAGSDDSRGWHAEKSGQGVGIPLELYLDSGEQDSSLLCGQTAAAWKGRPEGRREWRRGNRAHGNPVDTNKRHALPMSGTR